MDDDFNAQNGIAAVYEMAKQLNIYAEKERVFKETITYLLTNFTKVLAVFGIEFSENDVKPDAEIEALIAERDAARAQKNFARSDEIRDQLKEQGIILEDTPQGTRWKRS